MANHSLRLRNGNLIIRIIKPEDIGKEYIKWMNDYYITKYTEQKFIKHDFKRIKRFIIEKFKSKYDYLFGIFFDSVHIGNILISSINLNHKSCNLSYLIGKKEFWGKGITSYAISEMIKFAFNNLKLEKISAGCYENNIGSLRVLEKNKFKIEGRIKKNIIFENKRIDSLILGLNKSTK